MIQYLKKRAIYYGLRLYVWLWCKNLEQTGLQVLREGSVRDIQKLGETVQAIGEKLDQPQVQSIGHAIHSEAEKVVLRRKWSWRNWRSR